LPENYAVPEAHKRKPEISIFILVQERTQQSGFYIDVTKK
jgi:hypothetical protein